LLICLLYLSTTHSSLIIPALVVVFFEVRVCQGHVIVASFGMRVCQGHIGVAFFKMRVCQGHVGLVQLLLAPTHAGRSALEARTTQPMPAIGMSLDMLCDLVPHAELMVVHTETRHTPVAMAFIWSRPRMYR